MLNQSPILCHIICHLTPLDKEYIFFPPTLSTAPINSEPMHITYHFE